MPCHSSVGPIPKVLVSMNHLHTKIYKHRAQVQKYRNSPFKQLTLLRRLLQRSFRASDNRWNDEALTMVHFYFYTTSFSLFFPLDAPLAPLCPSMWHISHIGWQSEDNTGSWKNIQLMSVAARAQTNWATRCLMFHNDSLNEIMSFQLLGCIYPGWVWWCLHWINQRLILFHLCAHWWLCRRSTKDV